jgi:hypothetical protein
MGEITVYGTVPDFVNNEFYLPVDNGLELQRFWKTEKITTKLRPVGDKPAIAVRGKRFVQVCQPGDKVKFTIKSVERKNGVGITGIDLQVI